MTTKARWTSPNQLVAFNLWRARTLRGMTQEQAAEALEPYLGVRWSKATFSAAERSYAGGRVRQFTADDIVAFAQAFRFPVPWFLMPPDVLPHTDDPRESRELAILLVASNPDADREHVLEEADLLDLLFNDDPADDKAKLGESWLQGRLKGALRAVWRDHSATKHQRRLHDHAERLARTILELHSDRIEGQAGALRAVAAVLEEVEREMYRRATEVEG